ncbi:MAG: hypothetical protein FJ399_18330 [Verrucomicrobia bacterium]|nr:hypothetical protein [Verrucomicrobiota bacterium]
MIDRPTPPASPAPDWEAFLRKHVAEALPEIQLSTLQPGDRLVVLTDHTAYTLVMRGNYEADLTTNRPDRPSGRVLIHGCTFGASSSIKPDHVFCGGNLEFAHGENNSKVTTTTTIRALQLSQAKPG